jgi:hypothetical protein
MKVHAMEIHRFRAVAVLGASLLALACNTSQPVASGPQAPASSSPPPAIDPVASSPSGSLAPGASSSTTRVGGADVLLREDGGVRIRPLSDDELRRRERDSLNALTTMPTNVPMARERERGADGLRRRD